MKLLILTITFSIVIGTVFSQDYALKVLENSPRHHEWAKVKYGERTVHCFVVYPEKPASTQAVIIIHENRGLTDK